MACAPTAAAQGAGAVAPGVRFTVRVARDGSAVLGRGMERFVFRPWGMGGGGPGERARVILNEGTDGERELGKLDMFEARAGDTVTILTPGGGGYGDPLDRPVEDVVSDVVLGYVSAEGALREYGVLIDGEGADIAATEKLRASMREARTALPDFDFGPERTAWEKVFDDTTMMRMTDLLMRLPSSLRSDRRQKLFAAVVPGLSKGVADLSSAMGDPAAARVRLADLLEKLEAEVTGAAP